MRKTDKNLYLLYAIFATGLIIANVIGSKVFATGLWIFGSPIVVTAGAICYPTTFIVTGVVGEIWGKEKAHNAVKIGFVCQLIALAIILIGQALPAVDPEIQKSYNMLLGQNWAFVLASLTAYLISQNVEVAIFHKIRNAYIRKHGSTKGGKWQWNSTGTIVSQLVDSAIFASIAFGFGFGWFSQPHMVPVLINMILGQWLLKAAIALLDNPLHYYLTRFSEAPIQPE